MKQVGVVFLSKKLTSKAGNEYYSGKLEGAEGFNLMAFVKESQAGKKYLSLVEVDDKPVEEKTEAKQDNVKVVEKPKTKQGNLLDNTETIIDPNDLPF